MIPTSAVSETRKSGPGTPGRKPVALPHLRGPRGRVDVLGLEQRGGRLQEPDGVEGEVEGLLRRSQRVLHDRLCERRVGGEVSTAGLITTAPWRSATAAISSSSVETTTAAKTPLAIAVWTVRARPGEDTHDLEVLLGITRDHLAPG